jgi:hypothetical protein
MKFNEAFKEVQDSKRIQSKKLKQEIKDQVGFAS